MTYVFRVPLSIYVELWFPYGYTPCPFKHDMPESLLEMLWSIAATHDFPHTMKSCYEEFGADFTQHLYVLEVNPIKGITP